MPLWLSIVRISFDDVEEVFFHHGDADEAPHCALHVVAMPDITEEASCHCEELRNRVYPSWFFFEFKRGDLKKLEADVGESELGEKMRMGLSPVKMGGDSLAGMDATLSALRLSESHHGQGVVRVVVLTPDGKPVNAGSGCIVGNGDVILTAAHVVKCLQNKYDCLRDQSMIIMIAPLKDPKAVPLWQWRATVQEPQQIDEQLDLVALRISAVVQSMPPSGLTPRKEDLHRAGMIQQFQVDLIEGETKATEGGVELGSVETVEMGHPLSIWGFPPLGGDTVTRVSCQCDGFKTDEGRVTAVKVHGSIDNGFSGGPVLDANGTVIGILSLSCGKIDYCRPVDAARPLILAASNLRLKMP